MRPISLLAAVLGDDADDLHHR
uniref:Uncharacterized protein n=1 Tax=Oryza punctata TaxID=4537 RepID=A0A0E0LYV8_ORYPU